MKLTVINEGAPWPMPVCERCGEKLTAHKDTKLDPTLRSNPNVTAKVIEYWHLICTQCHREYSAEVDNA